MIAGDTLQTSLRHFALAKSNTQGKIICKIGVNQIQLWFGPFTPDVTENAVEAP